MHARTKLRALLFLSTLAVSSAHLFAQYDQNDPPAEVARIGYLSGQVSLQAAGTDDWSHAPSNYPMVSGDRIYTGPGARAVVQLGGAELRLWQATDVTLTNITEQYEQIGLATGTFRLRIFQMDPGSQIEVDTPNGAAIVTSPGDYRFEAFPQNNSQDASSIVTIASGNAQITGPAINQPLSGGYSIGLFGTNPVELQYLQVPRYDDLDSWSISLDQRLQNSVSARYVSRQMVGYGDLDAYGSWNPNTEYGPGWFPTNVPYGWQPYSLGHWAYVAPWGYTWVDDAPWGFAPFHYGRWSQVGGRWGWFPGPPQVRPIYSPALVAFVGGGPGGGSGGVSIGISLGGGVGISAWFPIGVGEPYVPWYRCSPVYARQVNVTNVNVNVIRNTTIVNNYNTYITKTVVNNTTINNTVINNRTVNNVTVNNFNYSNRTAVTAIPASAMASGAPVAEQAVRLTPQQQQQLSHAPIAARPNAPEPAVPHPSLVRVANVPRPAARPTLMTPTGQARAVPSVAVAHPVALNKLPPPRIVPKNAAPPPSAPAAIQANRPGAPVPQQSFRPGAPITAGQPAPPRAAAPAGPASKEPTANRPTQQVPQVRPEPLESPRQQQETRPQQPGTEVRPAPVSRPAAPEQRPQQRPQSLPIAPRPPQPQTPVVPQTPPHPTPEAQRPPVQARPASKPAPRDERKEDTKEDTKEPPK